VERFAAPRLLIPAKNLIDRANPSEIAVEAERKAAPDPLAWAAIDIGEHRGDGRGAVSLA